MSLTQQIVFKVGKEEFSLPILNVQEIIRPTECTAIPESPEFVKGMINLRGKVIPVVDLKERMNIPPNGSEPVDAKIVVVSVGKAIVGTMVDGISGVVTFDESMISNDTSSVRTYSADYIEGIATLNDSRMIQILNLKSLFSFLDKNLIEDEIVSEEVLNDGKVMVTKKVHGIGGEYLIHDIKDKIISNAQSKGVEKEVITSIMEKIQDFLDALSEGDIEGAEEALLILSTLGEKELFSEVGKITRNLHNAITEFKSMLDPKLKNMALEEMPDATDKLNWVVKKTEEAAERTISLVEKNLSLQSDIVKQLDLLDEHFQKLEGEHRAEKEAIQYLRKVSEEMNVDFMDVILAQEYQDITGQIIKKIITLVSELEADLVELIKAFGVKIAPEKKPAIAQSADVETSSVETLDSQADVDSLLQEFGF